MEFVQIHIPTIQNWEVLGQKVTAKGETFLDILKKHWELAVLIGLIVLGVIIYFATKPKQKRDEPPKSGN